MTVSGQLPHQDNSPPYRCWSWWVVLFHSSGPSGELSWWGIVLGIVVPVDNGWALFFFGGELSLVGSCPRTPFDKFLWQSYIFTFQPFITSYNGNGQSIIQVTNYIGRAKHLIFMSVYGSLLYGHKWALSNANTVQCTCKSRFGFIRKCIWESKNAAWKAAAMTVYVTWKCIL